MLQIYFDCNKANHGLLLSKTRLCETKMSFLSCTRIKSHYNIARVLALFKSHRYSSPIVHDDVFICVFGLFS